jgi:hypothetical protein
MTFTSLDFGITCGRYGLETEERIPLCNINGVVSNGYFLLSWVGLLDLFARWTCRISEVYFVTR